MSISLVAKRAAASRPIVLVRPGERDGLREDARRWAELSRFDGATGEVCLVPGGEGIGEVLFGLGKPEARDPSDRARTALRLGTLAAKLPDGDWHLDEQSDLDPDLAGLALRLGAYAFDRYKTGSSRDGSAGGNAVRVHLGDAAAIGRAGTIADGVCLARDLINTPVNDMGPAELERATRDLAVRHGGSVDSIVGDALIERNFPMIHAVGRASVSAPRLLDFVWGRGDAPKVTLVGKGVCFDTGGLDIKPSSNMLLMKKDMGGAANVLGLASMIMAAKLDMRLRVLIPAVENSISANAFRPSDVLTSRKGKSVEIGNTDAEGRLVLADALAYGDEEAPQTMIDMATLTGAARVALGPDLPAWFTESPRLAEEVAEAGTRLADPSWRLPLYRPYEGDLASKVADTNNVSSGGFAGAITAALFLEGFVEKAAEWAHFDLYGWRPKASAIGPVGGEAYAIRSLFDVLSRRHPAQ
ncbi:leucyl aminopeptidase family protein [Fulvimarina sp. 2208YS6-2-32]|uniref:Leucyl aminopeptidase family protein n=1 Tax=Fulvimarina uroteuthidis TaxID=3098149 RepID=A0ABU5I4N5_9HYPH|nr:leucyl aminopeptidase family protein [Fulvimarina sp. 2208YS6-2-32]MDY8110052.1 leucyl aminopeptidase family protein [Fulvimarina sp. 2208YS6-2-32]